jgi:hypothetical protein
MFPLFTSHMIGGVDARWYGYMMGDYIEQARLGHLLIPSGQGAFAWNGAVHPFRDAPIYMAVGRIVDLLTFRTLNPFALEHLAAIASAVGGTLGFYAAATRLLPERRWIAVAMALLYLGTPSWLATVLCSEAYMSYMAFAALPVVLYGNARTVLRDDGRGYVILGAGLALIWMCHPPIAFLSTMATVVIQSGLVAGRGFVSWRNLAAGAATFAVLGAYYFTSMSELPPLDHSRSLSSELLQIIGFALFIVGIGRCVLVPRPYGWIACAAFGGWAVRMTDHPWFCWVLATAGIWLAAALALRLVGSAALRRHAVVALFLSVIAGAAVAEAWVGRDGIFQAAVLTLADNTARIADFITPLGSPMSSGRIFQTGWGLLAALAVCVLSLFGSRPSGPKLFFAAALGLVICLVRVPLASNFLVGRFPIDLVAMVGAPMPLRVAPVVAGFAAFAGVVWLSTANLHLRRVRLPVEAALACLVAWNAYQIVPFSRHTHAMTADAVSTERYLRHENSMLDAFTYQQLPIPSYYSHGVSDPFIESRLLDDSGKVRVGPGEEAALMEQNGVQKIRLTTALLPNSTTWVSLQPGITLNPGERLLLRFEFDPARTYGGYLIFQAEHAYREYRLPDSGQPSAFGVGPEKSKVLSLWNSGTAPEHYGFSLIYGPGNDIPHSGGLFGNLYVSHADPAHFPISLQSLIPYRARVASPGDGLLETFRVFMPGYRATVDGVAAPVLESREHLASVRIGRGVHQVELAFVGTVRLRIAAVVSALGWACILFACAWGPASRRGTNAA